MAGIRRIRAKLPLLRAVLTCGLLVAVFYLLPVEPDADEAWILIRAVLAVLGTVLVTALIVRLAVRLQRSETHAGGPALLVALFGGVVLFAFIDYLLAQRPGQFSGLHTKTDALYFAVTTLATVGYGDIYASGQTARVTVTIQQLYNLAVLATGGAVLANRLHNPPPAGSRRRS